MAVPPKLVVFDLGRVLVRICDDWAHACEVAGVAMPTEMSCDALRAFRDLSHEADRGLPIGEFCRRLGAALDLPPADVRRAHDVFTRGHYEGSEALLRDLAARGVQTACLSNTNDNHWALLSAAPYALHHLNHRFASHEIGHRKPSAAIYEHLESATGFSGGDILFFDDLEENVVAAVALGWRGHVVPIVPDPTEFLRERLRQEGAL